MTLRFTALSLAALGAALVSVASAADQPRAPLQELRCDTLENRNGEVEAIQSPGLHVLRDTAATGRFLPELPENISSILCSRNSVIPAANDDEVLWLGLPLHIAELGPHGRLAVLEIDQRRFRFRMIRGGLRADEQSAVNSRLDEFQRRLPGH